MTRPTISDMAGTRFENFINFKRFSNYTSFLPLVVYMPFGLLLGVLRLFIFLHALLLFYILPYKFPFRRLILRVMLTVTGIPISVHGVPKVDSKKLIVSNSVSNLDPFILALLCPNKMVVEDPVVKARTPLIYHFSLPADGNHDQILLKLKEGVNASTEPLLFFPEKLKTNGKVSLLKFSNLPFEVDSPIQPVTIQTSRFLFDISVSTILSTTAEDVFWCLVLPFTLFKIKYLPVTEKKQAESRAEFSCRVQSNMAKSMGVKTSDYSHHDVIEYSKCRTLQRNEEIGVDSGHHEQLSPSPSQEEASTSSDGVEVSNECVGEDGEVNRMLKQVKEVFPDFHPQCIISDLKKTRDVDATITNILEGKVESSPPKELSSHPNNPSLSEMSFKAKRFESNAANRQLSFTERKQAMLEAARLRYKIKHGLL